MASFASARSFLRSAASARNAAAASKFASQAKAPRSPFPTPAANRPASRLVSRIPVETSACLASMMPFHSATSSALMTSMLSVTRPTCGWLPEGRAKTR